MYELNRFYIRSLNFCNIYLLIFYLFYHEKKKC